MLTPRDVGTASASSLCACPIPSCVLAAWCPPRSEAAQCSGGPSSTGGELSACGGVAALRGDTAGLCGPLQVLPRRRFSRCGDCWLPSTACARTAHRCIALATMQAGAALKGTRSMKRQSYTCKTGASSTAIIPRTAANCARPCTAQAQGLQPAQARAHPRRAPLQPRMEEVDVGAAVRHQQLART